MAISYRDLGLVNTRDLFAKAVDGGYAIPAYNFNNLEQLQAVRGKPCGRLVNRPEFDTVLPSPAHDPQHKRRFRCQLVLQRLYQGGILTHQDDLGQHCGRTVGHGQAPQASVGGERW